MKTQLMTTTALVAAGLIAASGIANAQKASKPSLSFTGWVEGIVGVADQETAVVGPRVGVDTHYDSEFHIRGAVTLDNGIRIQSRAELEGETSGDQFDEVYMSISGSFGQFMIGSMDNAAMRMVTPLSGSWAVNAGQNLSLDTKDWIGAPGGHTAAGNIRLNIGDGDSNKLNYFTPRIEGFQLGVGYTPSFEECAATGTNDTGCNSSLASTSTNAHNGWAVGLTFDRKFDKVRVGLGAGYVTATHPTHRLFNGDPGGDPKGFGVGAVVSYAGFTISAGYKQERNRLGTVTSNSLTSADVNVLNIGAGYEWGKNTVSIGWESNESPASKLVAGDDKTDRAKISYARDLGPGVEYRLNLFWADYQGENAGSADDNDGYALTTSVRVAF
jgi:predicted porin